MVQSCVVGKQCRPYELCEVLRVSGFDVIVVIETMAVEEDDEVNLFLLETREAQGAVRANLPVAMHLERLLEDKAVYQVQDRVFVFVHRGKVESCSYTVWSSTAVADHGLVHFGSLDVYLYQDRQRAANFKLGIVEFRCQPDERTLQALQRWIVLDKVAAVTGWWGCGNGAQVGQLAARCRSSWSTPLYQDLCFLQPNAAVAEDQTWTICSYFLLFARCYSVT